MDSPYFSVAIVPWWSGRDRVDMVPSAGAYIPSGPVLCNAVALVGCAQCIESPLTCSLVGLDRAPWPLRGRGGFSVREQAGWLVA